MKFYNGQHQFYCGVDLHTKRMYVCILDREGNRRLHRNVRAKPREFLSAIRNFRDDLVVGAECMFTWYWLADLCRDEEIHFLLGHALYMKAIHGGKKKDDKIDSEKIAKLMRGGTFPLSYVYPREMRATRDLVRRSELRFFASYRGAGGRAARTNSGRIVREAFLNEFSNGEPALSDWTAAGARIYSLMPGDYGSNRRDCP